MPDYTMKKAKEDWLKRVMKSKEFNHATKTFAWCVMDHMYGDKTVSNPGGALIKKETNIATNKQGAHRKALVEAGALTCVLVKNAKGDWDGYEYTLCLDWEPTTAPEGSTPLGNTLPPTGEQGLPQKGTGVPPTGEMNLSNQSIKEPIKESIKTKTVPDGPVELETDVVREGLDSPSSSNCDSELYPLTEEGEVMNGTYWMKIKKVRPLTKEEKALENRQSAAYMKKQREKETPVLVGEPW